MEKEYARALKRSLKDGTDEAKLVDGLMKHLNEQGRAKLLPGILRELKRLSQREATLAPKIEVASEGEKAHALKASKEAGIETSTVRVNHDLIRGWRARSGGVLIDRSAKQALVDLYQKITN